MSPSLCWLQPTAHNEMKRLDPQHVAGLSQAQHWCDPQCHNGASAYCRPHQHWCDPKRNKTIWRSNIQERLIQEIVWLLGV